jgi:Zn-dependent protease with chaperone function
VSQASRRFYQSYYLLTTLLPAVLATLICFAASDLSWRHGIQASRPLYFTFGGLFLVAAAGAFPLLSSLGFGLSGLPTKARRLSAQEREDAGGAFDAVGTLNRDIEVSVVELGETPFLAASPGRPDRIWISAQVLATTPAAELRCLILHERAHLAARGWFDDLFSHWAYFTVAASIAGLPLLDWPLRGAALALTPLLLLRLRLVWSASREREADRLAAEVAGLAPYSWALTRYLARFETAPGSRRLRMSRLLGMGLSKAEALTLTEAREDA